MLEKLHNENGVISPVTPLPREVTAADYHKLLVTPGRGGNLKLPPVRILDEPKKKTNATPVAKQKAEVRIQLAPHPVPTSHSSTVDPFAAQTATHSEVTESTARNRAAADYFRESFRLRLDMSTPEVLAAVSNTFRPLIELTTKKFLFSRNDPWFISDLNLYSRCKAVMIGLLKRYPLDSKPPLERYLQEGLLHEMPPIIDRIKKPRRFNLSPSSANGEVEHSSEEIQPPQE